MKMLALATLFALAGSATTNILLSRIDQARAEAHRAYAHTKVLEAQLVYVHSHPVAPPADPRVDVCLKRTKALRSAHLALVRTGLVSMPNDPGGDWVEWPEVPR